MPRVGCRITASRPGPSSRNAGTRDSSRRMRSRHIAVVRLKAGSSARSAVRDDSWSAGSSAWPSTFAGILVGERRGRRLLWRGTVAWGLGLRTAKQLLGQGRERTSSPFHDFRLSRGVTWLEPTLTVEVTYSEVMEGRLRDPVYRGLV